MLFRVELIAPLFLDLISKQARLNAAERAFLSLSAWKINKILWILLSISTSEHIKRNYNARTAIEYQTTDAYSSSLHSPSSFICLDCLENIDTKKVLVHCYICELLLEINIIILFRPNLDLVPQVLPKTKINFEPCQMTDHTYVVVQVYGWLILNFPLLLSIFILNL